MNFKHKYRITVEDESTLEKKISFRARSVAIFAAIFFLLAVGVALAIFILVVTPLKTSLPGYLEESERIATEQQHHRLDSIIKVYEEREAYLSSIIRALNPESQDSIKIDSVIKKPQQGSDSVPLNATSAKKVEEGNKQKENTGTKQKN